LFNAALLDCRILQFLFKANFSLVSTD